MKDKNGNFNFKKLILIIILILILLVGIIVGYSFAYFTATVVNNPEVKETAIETGNMAIEFTDGDEITLDDAIPGDCVTKTFSVKNVGDIKTSYDVYMSDLINTFADKTDLVYTLVSLDGGYNIVSETEVPSESSKIVESQELEVGATHNYTLTIQFKETNDNQDDNKGKKFSTVIRINEVKEGSLPIDSSKLKVGDRVLYSTTGNQGTIDSWIVIKEGENPELVSETTSPDKFSIDGESDWLNWVGILNQQAASYGTDTTIVKSTRHMGYSNQIEYCNNASNCPSDSGYLIDTGNDQLGDNSGLVFRALHTLKAKDPSGEYSKYWLSGRYVHVWGEESGLPDYHITIWVDDYSGYVSKVSSSLSDSCTVRPIITLQSDVELEKTENENEYRILI